MRRVFPLACAALVAACTAATDVDRRAGSPPSVDAPHTAARAIVNAYLGCDPNGATACTVGSAALGDPAARSEMKRRLGEPTTWSPLEPGRQVLAELQIGRGPSPTREPDLEVYVATFERGQIYAYARNDAWHVVEIADADGAAFFSMFAGRLDPAGSNSFLGVPEMALDDDGEGRALTFVNGPCRYLARLADPVTIRVSGNVEEPGCAIRRTDYPNEMHPQLARRAARHAEAIDREGSYEIPGEQLAAGDALESHDGILLFGGWVDRGQARARVLREADGDAPALDEIVTVLMSDGSSVYVAGGAPGTYTAIRLAR